MTTVRTRSQVAAPPGSPEVQTNGAHDGSTRTRLAQILFLLNDAPYGSERLYNGIRVAQAMSVRDDVEVRIFMFGDAVGAAVANQRVPKGYYNVGTMIGAAARHGAKVACCGTCLDARGIDGDALVQGAERSTLQAATDWILWADKVLAF